MILCIKMFSIRQFSREELFGHSQLLISTIREFEEIS